MKVARGLQPIPFHGISRIITTDWQVSANPRPLLWGLLMRSPRVCGEHLNRNRTWGCRHRCGKLVRSFPHWWEECCPSQRFHLFASLTPLEVATVSLVVLRQICGSIAERTVEEMSVFLWCLARDLGLLTAAEILCWGQQAVRSEGVGHLARRRTDSGVALWDDQRANNGHTGVPLEVTGGLWGTLIEGLDLAWASRVHQHSRISNAQSIGRSAAALKHAAAYRCWQRNRVRMDNVGGHLLGWIANPKVLWVLLYKVCG